MLAVLAPGQGAQRQGFLRPWLEVAGVRAELANASEVVGLDLVAAGTEWADAQLADTAVAQPLLTAAALASAHALPALPTDTVLAGHSVGEIAAAQLAEVLTSREALALVAARGRAMAAAAAGTPGGMTAVLGGDAVEVEHAVETAGCWQANVNGPGQVVAAGPRAALDRLAQSPPAGARLRPLAVAGAFHTALMAPAQDLVRAAVSPTVPRDPRHRLLSNRDGVVVTSGAEVVRRLVEQVVTPVRWDRCVDTLSRLGVTGVIELAPGGTLTGLLRRSHPAIESVALRSPDDLPAAAALLEQHCQSRVDTTYPWRIVVSPTRGELLRQVPPSSAAVHAGQELAAVRTRGGDVTVAAAHSGHVVEWLAEDGDPVIEGQPLARLADEAVA